jgi:hypothetical protein
MHLPVDNANVPFELLPVVRDVVLTIAPVYLALHYSSAMIVG